MISLGRGASTLAFVALAIACGASSTEPRVPAHDWSSICARGTERLLRCNRIRAPQAAPTRQACEALSCLTSEYRPEALAAFIACETDAPCNVSDCASTVGATLPTSAAEATLFERKRRAEACDTNWDLPYRGLDGPGAETHIFNDQHWQAESACMATTDCSSMVTCLRRDKEEQLRRLKKGCR
jgi:hypothetical protein